MKNVFIIVALCASCASSASCAIGCAQGSPSVIEAGMGGGGTTVAQTICSPENTVCTATSDCCQNNGGMVCAGTADVYPTCSVICVSDNDCCPLPGQPGYGDACVSMCAFFTGQNYGACIPG